MKVFAQGLLAAVLRADLEVESILRTATAFVLALVGSRIERGCQGHPEWLACNRSRMRPVDISMTGRFPRNGLSPQSGNIRTGPSPESVEKKTVSEDRWGGTQDRRRRLISDGHAGALCERLRWWDRWRPGPV